MKTLAAVLAVLLIPNIANAAYAYSDLTNFSLVVTGSNLIPDFNEFAAVANTRQDSVIDTDGTQTISTGFSFDITSTSITSSGYSFADADYDSDEDNGSLNSEVGGSKFATSDTFVSLSFYYTAGTIVDFYADAVSLVTSHLPGLDYGLAQSTISIYSSFDSGTLSDINIADTDINVYSSINRLHVTFSSNRSGYIGLVGQTYAEIDTDTVSAVPEPGTYAMMIAGMGILGFSARRKA